ncbi:hypothetical protein CASFOL_029077 [Castilleja foliolosa]|uniref:Uncharacterized protein n=1 Tax=Castilleja foliolosa TaxID=1961234 RepID=A0ABD3CEH7_9LAMI
MPRERRDRSMSLERSRFSPFPCSSSSRKPAPINLLEDDTNSKQWEDSRCPVCMEHPHNAILLLCSSHEKGCRPFMCDTSYRHSNCFDQFCKSFNKPPSSEAQIPAEAPIPDPSSPSLPAETLPELSVEEYTTPSENPPKPKLVCPLCRGSINGCAVVESARHFMNSKSRSCACETCDYSGAYKDLRKHARSVHPLVRPADVDPDRQHNWRRLERQRDLADLLSTLHSSMGGEEDEEERTLTIDEGGWLTVFFLVRFIGTGSRSNRSDSNSTPRTGSAQGEARRSLRRLWGETNDGEPESEDEGDEPRPVRRSAPRRYVRRRYNNNSENQ